MAKSSFYSQSGTDPDQVQTFADLIGQATAAQAAAEAAQAAAEAAQAAALAAQSGAETAQTTAEAAAAEAAEAATGLDDFNDIYLGPFSTSPTLDNDGDALQVGALYFDTDDNLMYTWNGSAWVVFQGPRGDQGIAGADGADGADGAPGAAGADGTDGTDGADGLGYVPLQNVSGSNTITAQGYVTQTAYVTGGIYMFKAVGTNSGAATINVDGIGAISIKKNGSAVGVGDLFAGTWYACLYDGTDMNIILSGAML
jgi:hypothetical protein